MSNVEYMFTLPLRDAQGNNIELFMAIVEGEFIGMSLTEQGLLGNRRVSASLTNKEDISRVIQLLTLQLNQM